MKTLVIIASHNKTSFNNAIKDTIVKFLDNNGHAYDIRDLYDMKFNPVLTANDFENLHKGTLPEDILLEQKLLSEAEKLIIIYPIWWTNMPAILKGYFDRVLLYGFAYKFDNTGLVKLLSGKEALIFNTSGTDKNTYTENGMYEALNLTTDTGIFDFVGVKVKKHIHFSSIMNADDNTRNNYLKEVELQMTKLFQ